METLPPRASARKVDSGAETAAEEVAYAPPENTGGRDAVAPACRAAAFAALRSSSFARNAAALSIAAAACITVAGGTTADEG
ncbi:MAG: hypothetical protein ACLT98_06565 [Eggerthellaceae bacterium]